MIKTIQPNTQRYCLKLQQGFNLDKIFVYTLVSNANVEIYKSENNQTQIEIDNNSVMPVFLETELGADQKTSLKITNIDSHLRSLGISKETYYSNKKPRIGIRIHAPSLELIASNCNNSINTFVNKVIGFGYEQKILKAEEVSLVRPQKFSVLQSCQQFKTTRECFNQTKLVRTSLPSKVLSDQIIIDLEQFLEQNSLITT